MTSLSWFRSIILYSFVGNSGPRKVLLKGSAHASQQHDWICSLGTHTEPTPAENTRHCLSVHFPIHCASQSAHCHHHLPQSHTFCPHVLLSHLLGLHTCLLHICHYPQNDHWPAVPEENHLLGWLFDSDVFGALPWEDQILTVMAYDHYVAICKPLHYTTIIRQGLCQLLVVVAAWTGESCMPPYRFSSQSTWPSVVPRSLTTSCVISSVLQLACSDTYWLGMVVAAHSVGMLSLIFFFFLLLLISCIVMLSSLKSHGSEGQHK